MVHVPKKRRIQTRDTSYNTIEYISNCDLLNVLMEIVQRTLRDNSANDFSILMERNDSFFNDCGKWALFASMNFTAAIEKEGIDLTIRVKLAATRHFSYRQLYLWDGNILTVILIDSNVWYIEACVYQSHEISSQISMYQRVPIRSFYLRHHLPTRAHHIVNTSRTRVLSF